MLEHQAACLTATLLVQSATRYALLYESNTVLLTQQVECRSFESKLCDSKRFAPDTISLLLYLFLILIKLIKLAS